MSGKVLFVLTSHGDLGDTGRKTGFYLPELTPLALCARPATTSTWRARGRRAAMDGVKREDPLNAAFLDDPAMMARVRETIPLDRVNLDDYAGVFFVGGHGTMWDFPSNPSVARVAAGIYEAGGGVAAVCHGPSALVDVRLSDGSYLVAGTEVAAFTNEEEQAVELDKVVPFLLRASSPSRARSSGRPRSSRRWSPSPAASSPARTRVGQGRGEEMVSDGGGEGGGGEVRRSSRRRRLGRRACAARRPPARLRYNA